MKAKVHTLCAFILMSLLITSLQAQKKYSDTYIYELMENNQLSLDEIKQKADDYFAVVGRGQGTGHKHFMRWFYERQFHVDDHGLLIPYELEYRRTVEALSKMGRINKREAWVELGPSNFNVTTSWNPGVGRVRWVAVDPNDNNNIYAASDGGGVWKSTDGGTNWTSTMENKTAEYFSTNYIVFDPANSNIVYTVLYNNRIVKSTDGGATWNAMYSGSPSSTKRIVIIPNNSSIMCSTSSSGIHRSTNGGTTWTLVQSVSGGMEDIRMQPGSNDIMYASGSSTATFWRSIDGGATWTNITSGITNVGRTLIGVSPADPNIVYLVQANGSLFGRMYKSTDAGLNFTTTVVGDPLLGTNYFGYEPDGTGTTGQATHDMAIAVNPTNADEVHIAGILCWKSTNGGTSFTATTDWVYPNSIGYNHADVHCLNYVGATLYSSSDGGVCKSINDAGDWTYLWSGCAVKQLYRICCAKTNANTIGCGAQDNGQAYKLNGGVWNQWMGADGMDVAISTTDHNTAIGCYQYGGIYRTTNGGSSYSALTAPGSGNWVTPVVWHPNNADTVYSGYAGVYRSANKGTNWTKISGTTIASNINCLAVAASNTQFIYASVGAVLYFTWNGGTTWSSVTLGGSISSIAVHPQIANKVYVTTTAISSNVLVSTNGGTSFTAISTGLPGVAARAITVDDNTDESVYVGMNTGVYYKDNVNTNWVVYGTGLPEVAIQDIEIQKSGAKVRIATYGRGVWEISAMNNNPVCNAPTGLNTTNITTNSATVAWTAVSGAVSYTVEYKENISSIWNTLPNTTSTSINITGLNPATLYDWHVKTNCTGGSSAYVASSFTTLSTCGAPASLTSSVSGANNLSFSWSAVAGAVDYTFEYKLSTSSIWTTVTTAATSFVINNAAAGLYNCRVKTNCTGGSSTYTNGNDVLAHCTSNGTNISMWIDLVKVNAINRTSAADAGGYVYVTSPVTNLVPGTTYSSVFSAGFSGGSVKEWWKVYIDVNRNGTFESTEALASFTTNNGNNKTVSIIIPTSASLGLSRMRVVMRSTANVSSACGAQGNGEVEDYLVNISATAQYESDKNQFISTEPIDISVLPNPAGDNVNVSVFNVNENQSATLEIILLSGKVIYSQKVNLEQSPENIIPLNISSLLSGPYLVHLKGKETDVYTKLVKL